MLVLDDKKFVQGVTEMAGDRRVLTLGGIGSSLSQTSVFEFANSSPPQILKIDPSALARLSSSPSDHKLESPSSPLKLQLSVPDDLTPEEARASILLLLNTLLLGGSASPSAASQLSDILNNDAQTFTLDLEFDRQDDVDLVNDCWPDIISVAICALLDYSASSLSKLADAVAALSCDVLKTDTTTSFNFFTDSGDGFSDKDSASVDSDFNVLLNESKMRGNTQCDLVSNIPGTHGRLRSICKLIHSSTRVKLNSISPVHGGASKDLTRLFSFLASALQDLGEDSWERAKLFLDNLVKDNLSSNLAESFNAGCPNVDKLEDSIMSFVAFRKEKIYIKSLHEVCSLLEAVRKILSWEATISFISLEGSESIKVEEVVAGAKPDKKKDKKKKALGKGTTILMEFIKYRLQSVTSNIDAFPENLSNGFLSFLDLKDDSFDQLLQKVKEVVDSNESRRLPKIPEGTRDFAKEQMANVFKRHGAMTRDTPVFKLNETVTGKYGEDSKLICDSTDQVVTEPRWKGKGSKVKALANPISRSILDLQSSLQKSSSRGILCGDSVLLVCNPEQTNLLSLTCFGEPIITFKDKHDEDKQWFEFTLEEAFYLCFSLRCINIIGVDDSIKTHNELWNYMTSKNASFPDRFKAYSHLRDKNWVVRSGGTYGVDFVAYHHHPSLVHSEYGVLVLSVGNANENTNGNDRLRVWSDIQCTVRLLSGVAKTLLTLHVNRNGANLIGSSPSCLDGYSVEERTIISGWSPGRCREDQALGT